MEKLEKTKMTILPILILILIPTPAYAYLDPGTGSMLVSAIIGIIASLFFSLKKFYYSFSSNLLLVLGMKLKGRKEPIPLVFYSEGKQYWNTFKPVILELIDDQKSCTYFTQDPDDPGLLLSSPFYSSEFIGQGNKGFLRMNFLEASVCVMTTAGLDVLQIKRSKGVGHYVHLIHAPMDIGKYKLFSFDYFDSVFVSGDHQERSIRSLEKTRCTDAKEIYNIGCVYYDEMVKTLEESKPGPAGSKLTVLVAPTWGKNGLLSKYGTQFLKSLSNSDYRIIIKPHPQSFISEKKMLEEAMSSLEGTDNIEWNSKANGFKVMSEADILVSDISGIIFDFAFLFKKPVVTFKFPLEKRGIEASDLPYDIWELGILDTIGRQVSESDIANFDTIIAELLDSRNQDNEIESLREKSIYNFGNSAPAAARQLNDIVQSVEGR
ncbi:MAG: CDP-glycerol--glycerophosphate glycerophosphotransferase [Proteobacteria bacterium]|nr:CDP-glycerol--glycerophosphate glycerophosphotransferase [Pseudomonadota bacterium]